MVVLFKNKKEINRKGRVCITLSMHNTLGSIISTEKKERERWREGKGKEEEEKKSFLKQPCKHLFFFLF
jgi:hypothetical protein